MMLDGCSRRDFLVALSAGAAGLAMCPGRLRAEDQIEPEPFVYKTLSKLQLKADVYRPDDEQRRPVLLWIHGGGLIRGYRADVNRQLKFRLLGAGYTIVSIDYRLAPETGLPAIIEDVRDAYAWLIRKGPELFHADTSRVAVAGESAGGYLALMTGGFEPRPAVLVSLWGYGDITAAWYTQPSEFYRQRYRLISADEAWQGMDGPPVASRSFPNESSGRFYRYCRQQGLWTKNVSGFDPATQDALLVPYCPARNIGEDYPPTLLVHGTDDTDVPASQAEQMDAALAAAAVEHKLVLVPRAGHDLAGGGQRQVADAYKAALSFIERHVGREVPNR